MEAFLAPVDLSDVSLVETLASVFLELISSFSGITNLSFQRKNFRNLIRKLQLFLILFEHLHDSPDCSYTTCNNNDNITIKHPLMSPTVILCLKELYLLLYRSKILLDYCVQSSKLWLLLQNHSVSGHFHDLNRDISTLLDVFPLDEFNLSVDVREQIELLKKQVSRSRLVIEKNDEVSRVWLFSLLDDFENGRVPDLVELYTFFVEKLGLVGPISFRFEIEFLEEQIISHEGDVEPSISVLNAFVALLRYGRFLLFGFEEDEIELGNGVEKKSKKCLISREIANTFLTVPKDFCCPISLDLMRDPVIVSTGQTFDRALISRWIEEGHFTCPKTGQVLVHTKLVPNRALRNLIIQWCNAHEIPYEPAENSDYVDCYLTTCNSKAAIEANKATTALLAQKLKSGSELAKVIAAREIRLLAKTGKDNRALMAEAGVISYLKSLLISPNAVAQENSVTALLNLSIYDKNKSLIINEEGCLGYVVQVLRFGHTTEARENAAATLFSLSSVHEYKRRIADESKALEALAGLLREGTPRGKKDAVTALFNISTDTSTCERVVESGVVTALVASLGVETVMEEAAGTLALVVRQRMGAEAVGSEETAVAGLIGMMRCGTPRGKENAVAALLELCRSGGPAASQRVLRAPALAGLLQCLLFTGTKRARRKAASLARVFQRCDHNASQNLGGLGIGYAFARNLAENNRDASFVDDVSAPISVSVPVLT